MPVRWQWESPKRYKTNVIINDLNRAWPALPVFGQMKFLKSEKILWMLITQSMAKGLVELILGFLVKVIQKIILCHQMSLKCTNFNWNTHCWSNDTNSKRFLKRFQDFTGNSSDVKINPKK